MDFYCKAYTAKEEGYIYVYVSNENATLVEVYFDDFKVTHTKSNIVQYNEYYPFGLQTANSWTRENTTGNNFLGNGGTELNATSNLYDLEYRNYDPVLGRMNGVDPLATKFASVSPYNFSFNDPVSLTDPSGAEPQAYGSRSPYHTFYTYDDRVDYYSRGEFYYGSSSALSFHRNGMRMQYGDGTRLRETIAAEYALATGRMSEQEFIDHFAEHHGGGNAGLASAYGSSVANGRNWWLVFNAVKNSEGALGPQSIYLYFNHTFDSDLSNPSNIWSSYLKGNGARYHASKSVIDNFEKLAGHLLTHFESDLNTKQSLRFLIDPSQIPAHGDASTISGDGIIDVNIRPHFLLDINRLEMLAMLKHEFKHVKDRDSGFYDMLWGEIPTSRLIFIGDIIENIMEKRAYAVSIKYARDNGWDEIARKHEEKRDSYGGLAPEYQKYLDY